MLRRTIMSRGRTPRTRVTFRLPEYDPARVVSVVGSFNDWTPGRHVLVPRRDGTASVTITLGPGQHRFRYLATGDVWFDDPDADRIDHQGGTLLV